MSDHITYPEFLSCVYPDAKVTDETIRAGLTLDGFKLALIDLDHELADQRAEPLQLRCVGGFALMCHGLRQENPVTLDIDTVTPTPTRRQQRAIDAVAARLHLPDDWINNQTVFTAADETTADDCRQFDRMVDARYEPAAAIMSRSQTPAIDRAFQSMRNVTVTVADLATLAHTKAYAVTAIGEGRTGKDATDFIDVAHAMGANTLTEAHRLMPWLDDPELSDFDYKLSCDICDHDGFVDVTPEPTIELSVDDILALEASIYDEPSFF